MEKSFFIKNAQIINEGQSFKGSVLISGGVIVDIFADGMAETEIDGAEVIDAEGLLLIPGVIDDQVHFRDPGLTHKGDIYTESKAAVAGGITSYFEMPNTKPQAVTIDLLEAKYALAATKSLANYSFFMGATNDNLDELKKLDPQRVCGVKVFMGSSTGNMLVDNKSTLEKIFSEVKVLIATHCEDEETINANIAKAKEQYGENVPIEQHPVIRSEDACYKSSSFAVALAQKYNARLHVLHISTAKELQLFTNAVPLSQKNITAEVCVHHLLFDESAYASKGAFIKWNPAIKGKKDREALFQALLDDRIDVVATDHAPHLPEEKTGGALKAMSGGPMVQHSLVAMLEFVAEGKISYENVIRKMCHAPAQLFKVKNRGFIRKGFVADLVLVNPNKKTTVTKSSLLYKCAWSPIENAIFSHSVEKTFVNGNLVYNEGVFDELQKGERIAFY